MITLIVFAIVNVALITLLVFAIRYEEKVRRQLNADFNKDIRGDKNAVNYLQKLADKVTWRVSLTLAVAVAMASTAVAYLVAKSLDCKFKAEFFFVLYVLIIAFTYIAVQKYTSQYAYHVLMPYPSSEQ